MATVDVGAILKIVAIAAWLDGNIVQNVFAAEVSGGTGPFDDNEVVTDCTTWVEDMFANVTARVSDRLDGSEVRVYVYDSGDDDFDEIGSDSWVWNPAGTEENLPSGVSMLINAKTTDADVNGKKYIAGLTENDNDDGAISGSMLAALVLFAVDWTQEFTGSVSGAEFTPGIWSVKERDIFPMSLSVIIPLIPAYQRRRKVGVGI